MKKKPAVTAMLHPDIVASAQTKMRELGYVGGGPVTGKGGQKTESAILDFRNREGLPLKPTIDAELIAKLKTAGPKVVPVEQTAATATEIAPKVEAMAQTRWAKFWAKVTAIKSIAFTAILALLDQFDDAVEKLTPIKDMFAEVPAWAWLGCVGLAATLLAINLGKVEGSMTDGYQRGTVTNDNTEAKANETAIAEKESNGH